MLEVYKRGLRLFLALLLFAAAIHYVYRFGLSARDTDLIPAESTWKYLDDGTDPGSGWNQLSFSDTNWRAGAGRLGYGDGQPNTVLKYGPDSSRKYRTTYFRKSFPASNTTSYKSLRLRLLVDNGAVVYLNGLEVLRVNMPISKISHSTLANGEIESPEENQYSTYDIPNTLMTGTNVLAVEVHQRSPDNTNLIFDASLLATESLSLTHPPYLQTMTPNTVLVRWQTNTTSNSLVKLGSSPTNLNISATNTNAVIEHTIRVANLSANTKYYYSVGSTTTRLAGADSSHFFITPPAKGSTLATRIWVIGDCGSGTSNAAAVRNAYTSFAGSRYTNVWLMLGDDAYDSGTATEFTANLFNFYPTILRQSPLWSAFGNHDGLSADAATQTGPYYSNFSFPRSAEAGGLASNTEAYYSFDFANIHFVSLDSSESDRSPTGKMMTWLKNDIANTSQKWLIAFFHHPPYSRGGHNSDTDIHMVEMRKNANPILENRGVDLVMGGHSHDYERSYLIDGHYGSSSTFTSSMKLNGGNGRTDGNGAYKKATYGLAPHQGAVYIVMGSSGKIESGGTLDYPAMYYSTATMGSVVLDINGNRLDAKMLNSNGNVMDYFTIIKGSTSTGGSPVAPSGLSAAAISSSQIKLAWTDNSGNETGFKIERSPDGSTFTQIATVGTNVRTFSNTGLAASRKYYYRIRAYNGGGNSAYSNTASATTPAIGLPSAPTSLTATAVSSSQISLKWSDNSGNETGFKIERSTDGTTFGQIATTGSNATSYSNSGLAASKKYYYRVRAYNGNGNSAYSNTASATTTGSSSLPAAPSGLSASAIAKNKIQLNWTDNSSNESGFKIERSTNGTSFSQIITVGVNVRSYTNTGLKFNSTYYYRVRAYNSVGNSGFTNIASAKTPAH